MRKETIGGLYLAAGFALAGSAPTAGMALSSALGPFTVTAASLAFALPALAPFALGKGIPSRRELATTAALGFFGIFLYRICLNAALPKIGAACAGLLTGAAPIFTVLLSRLLLGERPSARSIIGVAAVCAGVVLVELDTLTYRGAAFGFFVASGTADRVLGSVLALAAAASEAVFAVISRAARRGGVDGGDGISRAALTATWALAFSVFPATLEFRASKALVLSAASWAALVWYGVFVTALSYVCWYRGIRRVEASRAALYTGIVPLVACALPALLLGERIGAASAAGAALILSGIALPGFFSRDLDRQKATE